VNSARDRFTVAHEFGHWMLHTNTPLARIGKRDNVPAFERAEPQANQFAAELLMPRHLIYPADEARDLVNRFGVSWDAACFRLKYVKRKQYGEN
ncbi:ImmA/IrrE family metallo-endopeptidase, partial [Gelidibacter sp. F2691]|nr:ImmA/IrrE family metallo-endopeptidase [Gelidibacter sp. F2691]